MTNQNKLIYSEKQIALMTLVGGPLIGTFFLSRNYKTIGNIKIADTILLYGTLISYVYFSLYILYGKDIVFIYFLNVIPFIIISIINSRLIKNITLKNIEISYYPNYIFIINIIFCFIFINILIISFEGVFYIINNLFI